MLSNKKQGTVREGKVQLINANGLYEKRRKSLGNKRNDIPEHYINEITQIYGDFKESEISKIFDNEDCGYTFGISPIHSIPLSFISLINQKSPLNYHLIPVQVLRFPS